MKTVKPKNEPKPDASDNLDDGSAFGEDAGLGLKRLKFDDADDKVPGVRNFGGPSEDVPYELGEASKVKPAASTTKKASRKEEPADEPAEEGDEDAASEFDSALVAKAKTYGFTDEEIETFGDDTKLGVAVRAFERKLHDDASSKLAPPKVTAETNGAAHKPAESAEGKPPAPVAKPDETFKSILDTNYQDKEVKDEFERLAAHMEAKLASAVDKVEQLKVWLTKRAQYEFERDFDAQISKLGEDYAELFGEGATRRLDAKSPEREARTALAKAILVLESGYIEKGIEVPLFDELFTQGLNIAHSKSVSEIEKGNVLKTARRKAGQSTLRGSYRNSAETMTPKQRAKAKVSAKLADLGFGDELGSARRFN